MAIATGAPALIKRTASRMRAETSHHPHLSKDPLIQAALNILRDHSITRPWLIMLKEGGYEILSRPNLKNLAEHNPKSPTNSNPTIILRSGASVETYAEKIAHELVHFQFTQTGRIYGQVLTPEGDIQQRLCEEAAVLAITADLIHRLTLGNGTFSGKAHPKMWDAHMASCKHTGAAFMQRIKNGATGGKAQCAAFDQFYEIDPVNRRSYYEYSISALSHESEAARRNLALFNQPFQPNNFIQFLPQGYSNLAQHIATMKPDMPDHFQLSRAMTEQLNTLFPRRLAGLGMMLPSPLVPPPLHYANSVLARLPMAGHAAQVCPA